MVQHEIIGDDMQAVILSLSAGDEVRAEAGAMMFMTDAIEMDAKMEGGFLGGLKRKFLAGESFFFLSSANFVQNCHCGINHLRCVVLYSTYDALMMFVRKLKRISKVNLPAGAFRAKTEVDSEHESRHSHE